jgi:DNA-binding NarL/FixJ family response regulator
MLQGSCALTSMLPNPLKVLLIDDHQLFLDGLSFSLQKMVVAVQIARASNAADARAVLARQKDFHLVLLDLSLPDLPGFTFLSELANSDLFIPVAILSASEEITDVTRALANGASGYISKGSDSGDILLAVQDILAGKLYTPKFYQQATRQNFQPTELEGINHEAITPRQMQVLQLLAQGLPNKRICQQLGLTEDTVKTHLKALFSHLNVHNRTECVAVATRCNLLD